MVRQSHERCFHISFVPLAKSLSPKGIRAKRGTRTPQAKTLLALRDSLSAKRVFNKFKKFKEKAKKDSFEKQSF